MGTIIVMGAPCIEFFPKAGPVNYQVFFFLAHTFLRWTFTSHSSDEETKALRQWQRQK